MPQTGSQTVEVVCEVMSASLIESSRALHRGLKPEFFESPIGAAEAVSLQSSPNFGCAPDKLLLTSFLHLIRRL